MATPNITDNNSTTQKINELSELIDWQNIFDITDKFIIFLQRTSVQQQILYLIITLILSWLLSKWLYKIGQQKLRQFDLLHDGQLKFFQGKYLLPIRMQKVLFACISFIVIILVQNILSQSGLTIGLLRVFQTILRSYFFYNIYLIIIASFLSPATGSYWHYNLLLPLFIYINSIRILNVVTNLEDFSTINIMQLFGTVFSLEDIMILSFGLYFWITTVVAMQKLLIEIISRNQNFDAGSTEASLILVSYILITLGVVSIFGSVDFNPNALAAIGGGLSIGIGFGLKEIISNFISGLYLLFEKTIKPGDVVLVNNQMGQVKKVSIRATTILNLSDNAEIIIPNQTFFTSQMTTYTKSDQNIRKEILVGASYNSDPEKVISLLLDITNNHPQVLKQPEPSASCTDFGESSINFSLRFYVNSPFIGGKVKSELLTEIWRVFAVNNIEIPFPQRDLHIRSSDIPFRDNNTSPK